MGIVSKLITAIPTIITNKAYMTIISGLITAVATVVIAYFTCLNYKMYKIIQEKDEEYKKQTHDLYQAIVISTLLSGVGSIAGRGAGLQFGDIKALFNKEYKGETKIFED